MRASALGRAVRGRSTGTVEHRSGAARHLACCVLARPVGAIRRSAIAVEELGFCVHGAGGSATASIYRRLTVQQLTEQLP